MAEFIQNCWGYQIWTCGFMRFQVGEQFLDAGGRYSGIWHKGGPIAYWPLERRTVRGSPYIGHSIWKAEPIPLRPLPFLP